MIPQPKYEVGQQVWCVQTWEVQAKPVPMYIGSILVNAYDYGCPVRYMMHETRVGSGKLWPERDVFASEQEAADALARRKQARDRDVKINRKDTVQR